MMMSTTTPTTTPAASAVALSSPAVTNASPSSSPLSERASKRRSIKLFNKPKSFTLFDVTNTPKSPTTPSKSKKPTSPKSMGKLSKKALVLQVAQLEQELKLVKHKAATLQEQNDELRIKLAAIPSTPTVDDATTTQVEILQQENKRLQKELDGYITRSWRDFCAVQGSPTLSSRKRAFFSQHD